MKFIALMMLAPLLSGCLAAAAVGTAGAVVGAGVHVTGAVVGAGVKTTGAIIGAATGHNGQDRHHDHDKDHP